MLTKSSRQDRGRSAEASMLELQAAVGDGSPGAAGTSTGSGQAQHASLVVAQNIQGLQVDVAGSGTHPEVAKHVSAELLDHRHVPKIETQAGVSMLLS